MPQTENKPKYHVWPCPPCLSLRGQADFSSQVLFLSCDRRGISMWDSGESGSARWGVPGVFAPLRLLLWWWIFVCVPARVCYEETCGVGGENGSVALMRALMRHFVLVRWFRSVDTFSFFIRPELDVIRTKCYHERWSQQEYLTSLLTQLSECPSTSKGENLFSRIHRFKSQSCLWMRSCFHLHPLV